MKRPARKPKAAGAPTEGQAVLAARAAALDVVERLIAIVRKPRRNAKSQVDAAKLVLSVAGISGLGTDALREELLRKLRPKVSKETYAEVVGALAEDAGVPARGTDADRGGADTEAR